MCTILIVEDDDGFRAMLSAVLELRGFDILTAENPAEALELIVSHNIDGVISDFQMPKADGLQFCRTVQQHRRSDGKNIPVWLMTGGLRLTAAQAFEAGAQGVFRKPFSPAEISKTIERHLKSVGSGTRQFAA